MNSRLMTSLIVVYSFVLIVSGCSSSGGDSAPASIPLDTSTIRTFQQGDSLTATLTIRDTATGNTATGPVTITVGQIVQNPFGIDRRSFTISGTLTGPAGSQAYSVRSLFYQDNNNSLYECGEFNDTLGRYVFVTNAATTPNGIFLETKSPMQLGDSTSGVVFFDDGSWEDCTKSVQSKENVSTPLGVYESYKQSQSCSYSSGTTLVNTIWTVPSIFNLKESGTADGLALEIVVNSVSF